MELSEIKDRMKKCCVEAIINTYSLDNEVAKIILNNSSWNELVDESDCDELRWIGHYPFEYWAEYIWNEYKEAIND
ncbi:hypothetical protein H6F38_14280 [Paenibacillus sp. EKM208P]|nr:hypothetical protein H6F38_14280 [Paenibacillus sp. EKM208P]